MEHAKDLETFLELIRKDFETKKSKNPSFSQRAYAQQLGITRATLNRLMNGEIPNSKAIILKIGEKINLSEKECLYYYFLRRALRQKTEKKKEKFLYEALGLKRMESEEK